MTRLFHNPSPDVLHRQRIGKPRAERPATAGQHLRPTGPSQKWQQPQTRRRTGTSKENFNWEIKRWLEELCFLGKIWQAYALPIEYVGVQTISNYSFPLRLYFDPLYPKGAAALLQSVWPPAPTAATIPPTTYVHRSGTWLIARSCDEIIMNGRFLKQSCFKKHYCEKYIARKMYVETTKLFIMIKHRPPKVLLFVQAFHLLFVPTCVCRVCTD